MPNKVKSDTTWSSASAAIFCAIGTITYEDPDHESSRGMNRIAPVPPAPPSPSFHLGTLFQWRPAARRWPFAIRAAICMGAPVLAGWVFGDITAGLMATIGSFTALYGNDRPYLNRAVYLAAIALSFALAVALGLAAEIRLLVIPAIVFIAMAATFLCNALRIGPPGAYMFAVACAAGTAMPVEHLSVIQIGLLVLAGGSFAWLAHMVGALVSPRGPERAAVAAAAEAIAAYVETVGQPAEDAARHAAALAMHNSWTMLVTHQPAQPRPSGTLSRLRSINRELHLLFAGVIATAPADKSLLADIAGRARLLAIQARDTRVELERTDPNHVPLGHHGLLSSLLKELHPSSPSMLVAARVGVATAMAGLVGEAMGLERAYWTMAAAVLMLHQGLDWMRTLQRGIERMSGTIVGLLLAGAILAIHPEGLWLVLTLMLLQFVIEICVIRNYALAVVFITAAALTIASGGHQLPDISHVLWVRGVDTAIGCAIGLLVLVLTTPRSVAVRIPQELVSLLTVLKATIGYAAEGRVTSTAARRARRDLQHRTIALLQAYDAGVGATPAHRRIAEQMWPAVAAAQRLAYRVLSACWSIEGAGDERSREEVARRLFGPDGERQVRRAVDDIETAIRRGSKPAETGPLPGFLETEIRNLGNSLVPAAR